MTSQLAAEMGYIECMLSDAQGIYIPQAFTTIAQFERFDGITRGDWDICASGPDHEHYWDAWQEILDHAMWTGQDGIRYRLMQEGDLYAVRDDIDIDWDDWA